MFQLNMLNIYHPYQCHLKGRAIMWQGACWNTSHVWFQFQNLDSKTNLKNSIYVQILNLGFDLDSNSNKPPQPLYSNSRTCEPWKYDIFYVTIKVRF